MHRLLIFSLPRTKPTLNSHRGPPVPSPPDPPRATSLLGVARWLYIQFLPHVGWIQCMTAVLALVSSACRSALWVAPFCPKSDRNLPLQPKIQTTTKTLIRLRDDSYGWCSKHWSVPPPVPAPSVRNTLVRAPPSVRDTLFRTIFSTKKNKTHRISCPTDP